MSSDHVTNRCQFGRGGFSHERKFFIDAPAGGQYIGIAFIDYCLAESGEPLTEGEPPVGERCSGHLVVGVVDDLDGDLALISVPDGGTCEVAAADLTGHERYIPV